MNFTEVTKARFVAKLAPFAIDHAKHRCIFVGIRGSYRDTMGAPGVNDWGMYDDALFIDSPDTFAIVNRNRDPSRFRPGEGFDDDTKGIASLDPGAWFVHRFDMHHGKYLALCQCAAKVTVTRDGKKENDRDTGEFGINIHCAPTTALPAPAARHCIRISGRASSRSRPAWPPALRATNGNRGSFPAF